MEPFILLSCVYYFLHLIRNDAYVIQMLWVNLIMDSVGSLALATQSRHEKKLLNRGPYGRDEYIVNKKCGSTL